MDLSMNEVEAQARKAAKGADYSWGEAEDIGKAVRWLCKRGVNGCEHLAQLLLAKPDPKNCPIRLGILILDNAKNLGDTLSSFGSVAEPALVIPFAAFASAQIERPLAIQAGKCSVIVSESAFEITGEPMRNKSVIEVKATAKSPKLMTSVSRASPQRETWETLDKFAHRTYAPATEESRMLGAGAGISDND